MRQSNLLLTTLREPPGEADVISHQLLLRAGFIRQLAAGVYSYLPLGRRTLRKVEQIVREEMDREDAQELLLPAMQPAELWQASGRYDIYGPELMRLHDRHDREFALGPTHEEVITTLVGNEVKSYRKLPMTLYQIQTKFRDERRPRFGLLRGREFLMKDAYSFDADWEGNHRSYQRMYNAYHRIFTRCGLDFRAVEADAGSIGGEGGTHEFMALADIGEDTIAACTSCEYAANLEKAESSLEAVVAASSFSHEDSQKPEKIHTPGVKTIDQLVQFLNCAASDIIKTVLFLADDRVVAVAVRGDHEINELKVKNYLGADQVQVADTDYLARIDVPVGFIGPYGLDMTDMPILIDHAVANMTSGYTGGNMPDYHYGHVRPIRDLNMQQIGDFRNAIEGDNCPRCQVGKLRFYRGIEVGHVFKLGTKYSEKLSATYLDAGGQSHPMIMGCYGIGVSRLVAAVAQQRHDEYGIAWPLAIAPYHVHLIPISVQNEALMQAANDLYRELQRQGVEVLIDDRNERAGVKFNDADLIGIPYRIIIGKDVEQGFVEWAERGSRDKETMPFSDAIDRIVNHINRLAKNA